MCVCVLCKGRVHECIERGGGCPFLSDVYLVGTFMFNSSLIYFKHSPKKAFNDSLQLYFFIFFLNF